MVWQTALSRQSRDWVSWSGEKSNCEQGQTNTSRTNFPEGIVVMWSHSLSAYSKNKGRRINYMLKKSLMSYIIILKSSTWNPISLMQPLKTYMQFKTQSWFTKLHTINRRKQLYKISGKIDPKHHQMLTANKKKFYINLNKSKVHKQLQQQSFRTAHSWAITRYQPHPPKKQTIRNYSGWYSQPTSDISPVNASMVRTMDWVSLFSVSFSTYIMCLIL